MVARAGIGGAMRSKDTVRVGGIEEKRERDGIMGNSKENRGSENRRG